MLIADYLRLLDTYVSGELAPDAFEQKYLGMFKNESRLMHPSVFAILDRLFAAVDAYCADAELRDDDDLDEIELLEEARGARDMLRSFKVQAKMDS